MILLVEVTLLLVSITTRLNCRRFTPWLPYFMADPSVMAAFDAPQQH